MRRVRRARSRCATLRRRSRTGMSLRCSATDKAMSVCIECAMTSAAVADATSCVMVTPSAGGDVLPLLVHGHQSHRQHKISTMKHKIHNNLYVFI